MDIEKKPKVMFCINSLGVGGAERLVVDDINEMLKRGISVRLLTLNKEPQFSLAKDCLLEQKYWTNISIKKLSKLKSWIELYVYVRREKPDLLVTHLWYANLVGRIIGKICGVKNIIIFEQNVYDTVKTKKMFWADKILQNFSNHIIAVSYAVKDSLIKNGINEKKITVIHNSIDTSKYQGLLLDIKRELSVGSKFIYIFIGRLIHQKGIDVLIRAFNKMVDSVLLIVGQGSDREKLEHLAKTLHTDADIFFLGVRKDIPILLNTADCFVLPSRYEGLPMVLIEALAAGKAIVVSDFEAGKEVINNESNGLVVERENVDMLALAMERIKNKDLNRKLGEQAKRDSSYYSITNHVDKILELV